MGIGFLIVGSRFIKSKVSTLDGLITTLSLGYVALEHIAVLFCLVVLNLVTPLTLLGHMNILYLNLKLIHIECCSSTNLG